MNNGSLTNFTDVFRHKLFTNTINVIVEKTIFNIKSHYTESEMNDIWCVFNLDNDIIRLRNDILETIWYHNE